jgi:sialate O-acetylesterase
MSKLRSLAAIASQAASWLVPGLLLATALHANVTPAPLFTDGAVLQRGKPVPVWGRADPGEKVTVTFSGQSRDVVADSGGRWLVLFSPLAASNQGADLVIAGKDTVTVHDVLVGEVWLCSGQSNMEFPVSRAQNAAQEIAAAHFPLIRHVQIARTVASNPAESVLTTGWNAATPANVGSFTAVGYFFARDIHQKLDVPIGLVHSSWGGTPIESWLSPAALEDPAFAIVHERWRQATAAYPAARKVYDKKLPEWTAAEAAERKKGPTALAAFLKKNPRPRAPLGPGDPWTPSGLFNGMIHPLLPYAMQGILWYQGESNADRAAEYAPLFQRLITTWREQFGQGDIPFYWVSLANFKNEADDPTGRNYAFLREAQARALALPNTGQALAIDLGNPDDIHPTNKQAVGRRLALLARNRTYGLTTDDTGPTFAKAVRQGATLRITFDHVATGLIAYEKLPQALELAGADHVWRPAAGRIENNTLIVFSPLVPEPVAVRYAWSNSPAANLYNGAGLPAAPFRSDE